MRKERFIQAMSAAVSSLGAMIMTPAAWTKERPLPGLVLAETTRRPFGAKHRWNAVQVIARHAVTSS